MNTIYEIEITTSNLRCAGTDCDVFIQIYGNKAKTDEIILRNSLNHRNKFERNNTDIFQIETKDVKEIKQIYIGVKKSIFGYDGWHLKDVKIRATGRTYYFPCNKWFDPKEDDCKTERFLFPLNDLDTKPNKNKIYQYNVIVSTTDARFAGTDADIFLKIYGTDRKTDLIKLDKSLSHFDKFERGQSDRFEIYENYLGELKYIKICFDNSGLASDWHLKDVIIECTDLMRRWEFVYNKWFDEKNRKAYIDLYRSSDLDELF